MKSVISMICASFMLVSLSSFAGGHGGGKMDDKKVDCTQKENATNPACTKK